MLKRIDNWCGYIQKDFISDKDALILYNEGQKILGGSNQRINRTPDQLSKDASDALGRFKDKFVSDILPVLMDDVDSLGISSDSLRNDMSPTVLLSVNTPCDSDADPVRGWHLDHGTKVYAGMLYIDPYPELGGMPKLFYGCDPNCDPAGYVDHANNTLVTWVNTIDSWHGVTSRLKSDRCRVMINFYKMIKAYKSHGYSRVLGKDHTNKKGCVL